MSNYIRRLRGAYAVLRGRAYAAHYDTGAPVVYTAPMTFTNGTCSVTVTSWNA